MPFGKVVGLSVSVTGAVIVTLYERVPVFAELSVALIVKLDVPAVVGVPESTPPLLRVSPAGNVPELTEYV